MDLRHDSIDCTFCTLPMFRQGASRDLSEIYTSGEGCPRGPHNLVACWSISSVKPVLFVFLSMISHQCLYPLLLCKVYTIDSTITVYWYPMDVEEDPVANSAKCLEDCKQNVLKVQAFDQDTTEDEFVNIYTKIVYSINKAISYRPRLVDLHLEKARALEALGYACLRGQIQGKNAAQIFEQALEAYERSLELHPSLWDDMKPELTALRLKVSSMACCLYSCKQGICIYDSVRVHIRGRSYFICATSDSNCYICDGMSGAFLVKLEGHEGPVTTLSLTPDGQMVLTGSLDMTARVWSIQSLETLLPGENVKADSAVVSPVMVLKGHTNRINCLVCTPCNTKAISSSTDNTLRIWDIHTGECLAQMKGHSSLVSSIALSSSGDVCASASGDASCRLWEIPGGTCYEEIAWESGPVVLCEFLSFPSHGEYLMTAHAQLVQQEARILLWDVFDKETGWVDGKLSAPCMSINELRGRPISTDSIQVQNGEFEGCVILACSCSDGIVHIWDITDTPIKLESFSLEEHALSMLEDVPAWTASSLRHASNKLNLVKFSPSGNFLAATRSQSHSIVIWDIENGLIVCQFYGHSKPIRKILWESDNKIHSFSEDGSIRGWKIKQNIEM